MEWAKVLLRLETESQLEGNWSLVSARRLEAIKEGMIKVVLNKEVHHREDLNKRSALKTTLKAVEDDVKNGPSDQLRVKLDKYNEANLMSKIYNWLKIL